MMQTQSKTGESAAYYAMLGLSLVFTILMFITLWPNASATKPNILGYRSVCTFAPAASALCGLLAGLTCFIRARFVSRRASSQRYRPPIIPLAVGFLLGLVAVVSTLQYFSAERAFRQIIQSAGVQTGNSGLLRDGTRSATAAEGDVSATVEVTIRSGKFESIRLTGGENMNDQVTSAITDAVLTSQSTDVDAVTGATASSLVLLQAIRTAAETE